MLTALQTKKQTHYFNLVDVDKNGYLESSDWAEIGKRLAKQRNVPEGTPEYEGLLAAIGTVWDNLSPYIDSKEKGRASLAEWLTFEDEKAVNCDDDWYEFYVTSIVQGVFDLFDADQNGVIDEKEYADLIVCFGVEKSNAITAFRKLDLNNDGIIDRDEFEKAVREFHKSDDESAPGNWLFGPYE